MTELIHDIHLSNATFDTALLPGNVRIRNRRTSVRLEADMWEALHDVAKTEQVSIHDICTSIAETKTTKSSLSSAIRVFLLNYYRSLAKQAVGFEGGLAKPLLALRQNDSR